jgi:hypothetical protein
MEIKDDAAFTDTKVIVAKRDYKRKKQPKDVPMVSENARLSASIQRGTLRIEIPAKNIDIGLRIQDLLQILFASRKIYEENKKA